MAKIFILVILMVTLHTISALECYHCEGTKECDNFEKDKFELEKCKADGVDAYCAKLIHKDGQVVRSCITMPPGGDPWKTPECHNGVFTCNFCQSDQCNAASTMGYPIYTTITAAFVIIVWLSFGV